MASVLVSRRSFDEIWTRGVTVKPVTLKIPQHLTYIVHSCLQIQFLQVTYGILPSGKNSPRKVTIVHALSALIVIVFHLSLLQWSEYSRSVSKLKYTHSNWEITQRNMLLRSLFPQMNGSRCLKRLRDCTSNTHAVKNFNENKSWAIKQNMFAWYYIRN